ncbi:MAG: hypothetical protein WCT02_03110 [Candidatus Paceibacterota bacterium]
MRNSKSRGQSLPNAGGARNQPVRPVTGDNCEPPADIGLEIPEHDRGRLWQSACRSESRAVYSGAFAKANLVFQKPDGHPQTIDCTVDGLVDGPADVKTVRKALFVVAVTQYKACLADSSSLATQTVPTCEARA